jgi:hypothetical protein
MSSRASCAAVSAVVGCRATGITRPPTTGADTRNEYALANEVDHPKTVHVRESAIVPELDRWLARLFDPENLDATVAAIVEVASPNEATVARL